MSATTRLQGEQIQPIRNGGLFSAHDGKTVARLIRVQIITMSTDTYIKNQQDGKFEVGDYYRITRAATQGELGWTGVSWGSELNQYIGKKGMPIQQIDRNHGIHLRGTNAWCPYFVLEKTDKDGNPLLMETLIEGKSTNATIFQSDEKRTAIIGNGSATLIGQFTKDELKKFIESTSW